MQLSIDESLTKKELLALKLKKDGKDSAHNSDENEDDEVMRDAREHKEEKENETLVNYNLLGSEECPVDTTASEIEYSMIWRIPKIENLSQCTELKVSGVTDCKAKVL